MKIGQRQSEDLFCTHQRYSKTQTNHVLRETKTSINSCSRYVCFQLQVSRRGPAEGFGVEGEEEPTSEEVRAELKRLYVQLEILRNKTLRRDNPHISKRRGGRKPPHRRFSLQVLPIGLRISFVGFMNDQEKWKMFGVGINKNYKHYIFGYHRQFVK